MLSIQFFLFSQHSRLRLFHRYVVVCIALGVSSSSMRVHTVFTICRTVTNFKLIVILLMLFLYLLSLQRQPYLVLIMVNKVSHSYMF